MDLSWGATDRIGATTFAKGPRIMDISRRHFFRSAAAVTMGFSGIGLLACRHNAGGPIMETRASRTIAGYGPLVSGPDLDLPDGFICRVIARTGEEMDGGLLVPGRPDGMAAFPGPNGTTVIVCNHELNFNDEDKSAFAGDARRLALIDASLIHDAGFDGRPCTGGTTNIVYDTKSQQKVRQFLSLAGTERNCAGGPTPWNTWLTCEETVARAGERHALDHGYNFEVPAKAEPGPVRPFALKEMGRFNHEAVAVDPASGIVYQTEDRHDGLIYRYVPNVPGELHKGGRLQALAARGQRSLDTRNWVIPHLVDEGEEFEVDWIDMENVESPEDDLRFRGYDAGAARFARGEGMWYGNDAVYFACTNGGHAKAGQIWRYAPSPNEGTAEEEKAPGKLRLFVEPNDRNLIDNADNLTMAPWGDAIVVEDGGGENRIVGVRPNGTLYVLGRNARSESELAGPTFSPDGSTLFLNIQHDGLTLAVTGPWERIRA